MNIDEGGPVLNAYDEPLKFDSGALRSKEMLPYWKLWRSAMDEWAKRVLKGEHYDEKSKCTHNWKQAIGTGDLKFIQQFYNHAENHLLEAKEQMELGMQYKDKDGETVIDHLGAAMWNIACLIEVAYKDPENLCKALNQLPVKF